MKSILKNHIALSAVVSTLIILVISVLLATVVTYYAVNVVSTRVQQEDLSITMQHVWFDSPSQTSEAAFLVVNTGGKDVVIPKIQVRGQSVHFNDIFYVSGPFPVPKDLYYLSTVADSAPTYISAGEGTYRDLSPTTNDLFLKSGAMMAVYINNPDSIIVNDVGTTVSINVFTSDSTFYKETNVQGSSTFNPDQAQQQVASSVTVSNNNIHAFYDDEGNQVGMVLTNGGTGAVTITDVVVNGKGLIGNNGYGGNIAMYDSVGSFTLSSSLAWIYGAEFTSTSIQGHMLPQVTECVIPAGQTAILYVAPEFSLGQPGDSSLVGTPIEISLTIQGFSPLTQQVTVQNNA